MKKVNLKYRLVLGVASVCLYAACQDVAWGASEAVQQAAKLTSVPEAELTHDDALQILQDHQTIVHQPSYVQNADKYFTDILDVLAWKAGDINGELCNQLSSLLEGYHTDCALGNKEAASDSLKKLAHELLHREEIREKSWWPKWSYGRGRQMAVALIVSMQKKGIDVSDLIEEAKKLKGMTNFDGTKLLDDSFITQELLDKAEKFNVHKVSEQLSKRQKDFVIPIDVSDPLSGYKALLDARDGSLASELFSKENRIVEFASLANLVYGIETKRKENKPFDILIASIERIRKDVNTSISSECSIDISSLETVRNNMLNRLKNNGFLKQDSEKYLSNLNDKFSEEFAYLNLEERLDALLQTDPFRDIFEAAKWFTNMQSILGEAREKLALYKTRAHWGEQIKTLISENVYARKLGLTRIVATTLRPVLDKKGDIDAAAKDQQFSSVVLSNDDYSQVYVVTVGSLTGGDWVNNLSAGQTFATSPYGEMAGLPLHAGFYNVALHDRTLMDAVQHVLSKNAAAQFYTIGHSLGGAAATVQGVAIKEKIDSYRVERGLNRTESDVKVMGFAAPMPFVNPKHALIESIGNDNMIYMDNMHDLVPTATLKTVGIELGYKRVGIHFSFDGITNSHAVALDQGMFILAPHQMANYFHYASLRENFFKDLMVKYMKSVEIQKLIETGQDLTSEQVMFLKTLMDEEQISVQSDEVIYNGWGAWVGGAFSRIAGRFR